MPFLNSKHTVAGIIEAAPRNKRGQENRIHIPWRKTLRKLTKKYRIPYYYMDNGSDTALQQWVQDIMPDIIVVYSMSQLLKENIFALPRYGTINLHPSYLPEYRGPNPDFWAYYHKELHPGVTVHYIDQGEDTGDIIFQERYDVPLGATSSDMRNIAINEIGVKLLFRAIDAIANGSAPRIAQPHDSPTRRAENIKPIDHKNIIDWNNWQIERIWHILRGTESWLNALEQPQGIYKGQRWEIRDFIKYGDYNYGTIYKKSNETVIACRDGQIMIKIRFRIKLFIKQILKDIHNTPPPPP
jgi:methionyl-tRNA formyltransferase